MPSDRDHLLLHINMYHYTKYEIPDVQHSPQLVPKLWNINIPTNQPIYVPTDMTIYLPSTKFLGKAFLSYPLHKVWETEPAETADL